MQEQTIDITPTPRVLSILGEIPFETWQCLAELTDNSLDAFASARRRGVQLKDPTVTISWSRESVPSASREVVVQDNGVGMDLVTLQNAARAGFSSNDPIHNLGLFGMGFNIATAKLGDETVFLSATRESCEWVGIRINFDELQKLGVFQAPVVRVQKVRPEESGTKIVVRHLKEGVLGDLNANRANRIRRRLEKVYSPILETKQVSVQVQGKELRPQPLCVWGESRFVVRKGKRIDAVQRIDVDLGEMFFDEARNRYVAEEEFESLPAAQKNQVIRRPRRLVGWLGIQRFCDPSDFGIDFIRNGRKILLADKSLFQFENPETGMPIIEYPIELGSTTGGRIVGELNVDYLIPTYQKNGFNTTDMSWTLTRNAIRGAGPFLPKNRETLGYSGANESPLGLFVNGYRRLDKGTKNLFIDNVKSKELYKEFLKGTSAYQSDEIWYKIAQEYDRAGGVDVAPVNSGEQPSDNLDQYGVCVDEPLAVEGGGRDREPQNGDDVGSMPNADARDGTSSRNELMGNAIRNEMLSQKYSFDVRQGAYNVSVYEVVNIQIKEKGVRRPCLVLQDGVDVDFFFDPTHPLLMEYPITAKQILLMELAERFAVRDGGQSPMSIYFSLVAAYMEDERINAEVLRNRATAILQAIKESLPGLFRARVAEAKRILKEDPKDEEACLQTLLTSAPDLIERYRAEDGEASRAFAFVPDQAIARFVRSFPELFMDSQVFKQPYESISFPDALMTARLRRISVEIVTAYVNDAVAVLSRHGQLSKQELIRYSKSLELLEGITQ